MYFTNVFTSSSVNFDNTSSIYLLFSSSFSWYDEECRDTRRCLQRDVTRGIYTHNQARATFQRLVRKKKRLHLAKFEDQLYRLFLGRESKRAWKMFNERQPTTQLTSPQVWHEYAKVLYDIPGQPPLPYPHGSRPHASTFLLHKM